MKIPTSVHILGQDFEIVMIDDDPENNFLGKCYPSKNKIILDRTLTTDKMGEVFFHEILHAIVENMCMKVKHKDINRLGVAIYAFLKDNGYV